MFAVGDLFRILKIWLRRLRFQRLVIWTQRGLALGLALGFTLGTLALLQARLLRGEYLLVILGCTLFTALLAAAVSYLWPIQPLEAARRFDRLFHLGERVSTALELNSSSVPANRLLQQQLDDAVVAAGRVVPARDLPLPWMRIEALLVLAFVLLSSLVWFRGQAWFQAAQQARQVQQAVQAQSEEIQQIIKDIQSNPGLTEEQKHSLSQPLEQALSGLQANPSQEGSVSVLTSTSEKLQSLTDSEAHQNAQALQAAGEQLARQQDSPLQSVGQQLAQGNPLNAAAELKNMDVSQMSEAEKQQFANQLQTLSDSLASTNPELSADLKNAAQALQNGDTAAAQQALDQAAKDLAKTGQQLLYNQVASETAQQMQQGAGQVLAAGGGQQASQMAQGQPDSNGQAGQQQGATSGGSGSGKGSSDQSSGSRNEAGTSPIPQNNGAGDGGEVAYEPIYAPSLIGGDGGPSVDLPSGGDDGSVIGQGPTTPSDPGQSLVPYSQVYSQYQQINQQAIDSGSVPFEFLQIIRSYFDSLKP